MEISQYTYDAFSGFCTKCYYNNPFVKHIPKYGIATAIFDLIGGILIPIFWNTLIPTPFTIVAIVCGYVGYGLNLDHNPDFARLGLYIGIILFLISIWPLFLIGYALIIQF